MPHSRHSRQLRDRPARPRVVDKGALSIYELLLPNGSEGTIPIVNRQLGNVGLLVMVVGKGLTILLTVISRTQSGFRND